jgi:hypothetical protein
MGITARPVRRASTAGALRDHLQRLCWWAARGCGGTASLQHGTLPLYGDITRIAEALAFDGMGERRALQAPALGRPPCRSLGRRVSTPRRRRRWQVSRATAPGLRAGRAERRRTEAAEPAEKYSAEEWTESAEGVLSAEC